MESLYLALKKQQKQSISDSPVSTPPLLGFSIPVSQSRNNSENETTPSIPQETTKFKGILVPVHIDILINNRNPLNGPIPQDSSQASRRRIVFVNSNKIICLHEKPVFH